MKAKKSQEIKKRYFFEGIVIPVAFELGKSQRLFDGIEVMDLNNYLAPRSENYFLVQVNGESMIDENIFDGDILVVDKTEIPSDGKIVIAALNGEMAVKKYRVIEGIVYLYSANKRFLPIKIDEYMEFEIQGAVKHVIHSL